MSNKREPHAMNRRSAVIGTMAGIGSIALSNTVGCQSGSSPGSDEHRIYVVTPNQKRIPRVLHDGYAMRLVQPMLLKKQTYVVWALPKEARALAGHEAIKSTALLKPDQVSEIDKSQQSTCKLAVELYPNSSYSQRPETFASLDKVAELWNHQFRDSGVTVEVVKAGNENMVGMIPTRGQLLLKAASAPFPDSVLETVKSHPQTLVLRWGEVFQRHACPRCGSG